MTADPRLADLTTPSLILDEQKMMRNIVRLADHAEALGVSLRPHLKTAKSVDVARRLLSEGVGPATVSTLAEAEAFFAAGVCDILYAVGIAPQKLPQVLSLRSAGCDLSIILDNAAQAEAVVKASQEASKPIPVLIEIDSDGHRGGLRPDDPLLINIGRILHEGGAALRGVMTHAGESYTVAGKEAHAKFAEIERAAAVDAASTLRGANLPCPVVSVGSTPTAHAARDLSGVTELRAGVYVFFDLVMAGIGVCHQEDIALSVMTTVIGHQDKRGWVMVDAGWMAMSRDKGTVDQALDQGYGVVCDETGKIFPDLILSAANQEHGIITRRSGSMTPMPDLPVGTRLRILPNHACATAAQHSHFNVIPADTASALMTWPRFGGW
ncbi:alanine racemase [Parasedimentitalea huanghaiensis]|uniref:DSD1 family PLP-dependent enzyme n=1 Tax=Parasedimentitalea huanghaiensis TaxID=2682100 RepID=A0A6L6WI62_9RHOB|nr:alanine racemase [Zongyanglinia huanghaiensis]MVO17516.1 DSD1 family PLP-dependent enzyme [Zongyanglinia huanghaiensis]